MPAIVRIFGLAHVRRAGNRDDLDAQAHSASEEIADAAVSRRKAVEMPAPLGAQKRRARKHGERHGDLELPRSGTVKPKAPRRRRALGPLAAQQHLMRRRFESGSGQRGPRHLTPSEHSAQTSHDASSTIQAPGS